MLAQLAPSLARFQLCDLDLPLPVLLDLAKVFDGVLLDDESDWLGLVLELLGHSFELPCLVLGLDHGGFRLLDVLFLALKVRIVVVRFPRKLILFLDRFTQVLFQMVQLLHNLAGVQLQLKKLFVAVIDVLDVLFVFNLQLVEVNELQVLSHLVLVLYLALRLQNLHLVRHIFRLKLVDLSLFLLEFVEHVLGKLFSVVLADAAVFCRAKETAEVESLLSDLSDGEVSSLKDSLKSFQQGL